MRTGSQRVPELYLYNYSKAQAIQLRASVLNKDIIEIIIYKDVKHPEPHDKPRPIPEIIKKEIATVMIFVLCDELLG